MIIKGLSNIIAHLQDEHQKNLDEWCKRKGLPTLMAKEVQRQYRRRNPRWFEEDDADYELEMMGYQAVGAAGNYFEIPNR